MIIETRPTAIRWAKPLDFTRQQLLRQSIVRHPENMTLRCHMMHHAKLHCAVTPTAWRHTCGSGPLHCWKFPSAAACCVSTPLRIAQPSLKAKASDPAVTYNNCQVKDAVKSQKAPKFLKWLLHCITVHCREHRSLLTEQSSPTVSKKLVQAAGSCKTMRPIDTSCALEESGRSGSC